MLYRSVAGDYRRALDVLYRYSRSIDGCEKPLQLLCITKH